MQHSTFIHVSPLIALAALACSTSTAPVEENGHERPAAPAAALPSSASAGEQAGVAAESSKDFNPRLLRRFVPLRERFDAPEAKSTDEQIALGRMLYFDKRLSKNRDVSCNSCHQLDAYGVDGEKTSPGDHGQRGGRNSPTVYNAGGFFAQFWDGRAPNVEEQAKGPILNPVEMAMPDAKSVVERLEAIPGYLAAFRAAFPDQQKPLTFDNAAYAIGAFERGLSTPSRWDKYLKGEKSALTSAEVEGLKVFTNVGCMVCHTGEFLGGNSYQRAGAVEPWPNQNDEGRQKVTANAADKMMFKVPTLRNIAKTAPYFHDGSAATLPEAVRMMGTHQLGLDLSEGEVASIVTWLEALTGDLPSAYIAEPSLPADANKG